MKIAQLGLILAEFAGRISLVVMVLMTNGALFKDYLSTQWWPPFLGMLMVFWAIYSSELCIHLTESISRGDAE